MREPDESDGGAFVRWTESKSKSPSRRPTSQCFSKTMMKIGLVILGLLIFIAGFLYIYDPAFTRILLISQGASGFPARKVDSVEFTTKAANGDSCFEVSDRIDCYPVEGASQAKCEERGCCWQAPDAPSDVERNASKPNKLGHLATPWCFYPIGYSSYRLVDAHDTPNGFSGLIQRKTDSFNVYPSPIELLQLKITFDTNDRLRIQIFDSQKARFQVPFPILPEPPATHPDHLNYVLRVQQDPFSLQVARKNGGEVLFDTSAGGFSFYDQFIEISSFLPSNYIYGLGEHSDRLSHPLDYTRFTFFATDTQPGASIPLYGSHPFYLSMEEDGRSHGVLLLNSNAMDVILSPAPAITYRTIGGIVDISIFLGPSPKEVVAQYIAFVGKPALPPYWALGFHLCKYGYGSLNRTKEVMQRNIAAGIPLDVQWNDIDYMDKSHDFTVDHDKFFGISRFVHSLHERGMHYVIIIDPGISSVEEAGTYAPFDDGLAMGIFLKNSTGGLLEGKVWTGDKTVFPDFTHPNATEYWTKQIADFHGEVGFDGLWIDMNEPSNFVDGSVCGCPNSSLESPPYLPNVRDKLLASKTVCMTARHFAGQHYDLHNLYGLTQAMATNKALLTTRLGRRPFIISRSTFVGQGKFSGHWSGDIPSTWEAMQRSIPTMLNFNMFGVPLVGADICGFNGNTTEELCQRWQQLGAFYPFSRNHNSLGNMDQDPAAFGPAMINSTRDALLTRYMLLPVYYNLFYRAALNGSTVVRPLFFEFPKDRTTYRVDWQFMIGEHLMVSPVLTPNTTEILAYFPRARWYRLTNGSEVSLEAEQWVKLPAPMEKVIVHVRGGAILPTHHHCRTTTTSCRKQPLSLLVYLDERHEASGELFWDDGDRADVLDGAGKYTHITFRLSKRGVLENFPLKSNYADVPVLSLLYVVGGGQPHSVLVNGKSWMFEYDKELRVLALVDLQLNLLQNFKVIFVF